NHSKYGELIYSHSEHDIFVNLFIPSTLNWKEKGIELEQTTKFPYENNTEIVLKLKNPKSFVLNIRYPKWATDLKILVNGKLQKTDAKSSNYVSLTRKW